jgi:hypothetical protein
VLAEDDNFAGAYDGVVGQTLRNPDDRWQRIAGHRDYALDVPAATRKRA